MTDRFHSLQVVLEQDVRDDDLAGLIAAIRQFRGVIEVTGVPATSDSWMAEARAKRELGMKLLEVLKDAGTL